MLNSGKHLFIYFSSRLHFLLELISITTGVELRNWLKGSIKVAKAAEDLFPGTMAAYARFVKSTIVMTHVAVILT